MKADVTYLARITIKNVNIPEKVGTNPDDAFEYVNENAWDIIEANKDNIRYELAPVGYVQAYKIYDDEDNLVEEADYLWEM